MTSNCLILIFTWMLNRLLTVNMSIKPAPSAFSPTQLTAAPSLTWEISFKRHECRAVHMEGM